MRRFGQVPRLPPLWVDGGRWQQSVAARREAVIERDRYEKPTSVPPCPSEPLLWNPFAA
jgi:hypothetical protein